MIHVLALVALGIVVYGYLLFPLLVFARGWFFPRPWRREDGTPSVDFIIVCHNEAAHIGRKLGNIFGLNYPRDRLRVIVASDGSSDGTDDLVNRMADDRVTLVSFSRRGKIPALNDAVRLAQGEILVFSDANSQFADEALRNLVRHFADPEIGCVAGNQVYTRDSNAGAAAHGEQSYWNFDRMLKIAESRAGNAISATGAIYAIRRELFQEVPSGVTDDFTISARVISQGYRLVFDPQAIAWETVAGEPGAEFRRKTRVMTRGFHALWLARNLLNPFQYGFYALQLFSHKLLRRLMVFPLLLLLAMVPWLWNDGPFFHGLALAQVACYALALAGWALSRTRFGRIPLFSIPYYFCLVNAAALFALANVLIGRKIDRWDSFRADNPNDPTRQQSLAGCP